MNFAAKLVRMNFCISRSLSSSITNLINNYIYQSTLLSSSIFIVPLIIITQYKKWKMKSSSAIKWKVSIILKKWIVQFLDDKKLGQLWTFLLRNVTKLQGLIHMAMKIPSAVPSFIQNFLLNPIDKHLQDRHLDGFLYHHKLPLYKLLDENICH